VKIISPHRLNVRRLTAPVILVILIAIIFYGFFAYHLYLRHQRFGTFDYDLGIWDQSVWLISRGHSFNTIRGLNVFGFHATPALWLLAPFSWLGAGPVFLNSLMVFSVAVGAWPVFRPGKHLLKNEWWSLVLAVAFLMHFSTQWMVQSTFHPEVMAVTPLLFAWLATHQNRWGAFAGWAMLAIAWKEDAAVVVAMMGLVLLMRGDKERGLTIFGAATAWFALVLWLVIPSQVSGGAFYLGHFGHLGDGPLGMLDTLLTNPTTIWRQLSKAQFFGYFRDLFAPFGFTPLLSPGGFLIGGASSVLNLLAFPPYSWRLDNYYAALPVVGATLAAVEGVARPSRESTRAFLVGLVGVSMIATSITWGAAWYSDDFKSGRWPNHDSSIYDLQRRIIDQVPDDAAVSASYLMVSHLSHREKIYTFPNPWAPSNWGIGDENPHSPDEVTWLVIDKGLTNPAHTLLLYEVVLAEDQGWTILFDEELFLVASREASK